MSIYDPFRLYVHHQKKSHDGQVIRKKLVSRPNYAISEEMIKQAQEILTRAGIRGFNSSYHGKAFIFKTYPNIQLLNFAIPNGTTTSVLQFSTFWDSVKSDFSSIYNNIPSSSVINISFRIILNSVAFGPNCTSSPSSPDNPINVTGQFQFDGFNSIGSQGGFFIKLATGKFGVDFISYSTNQFYVSNNSFGSDTDSTNLMSRTNSSQPYLTFVETTSPEILDIIKNSDFEASNPTLFVASFQNSSAYTFTLSI